MNESIAIIILGIVLIALAVERYLYQREMNKKISEWMKAVMSKNVQEFTQATKEEPKESARTESEEVILSEADDDTFDKHIKSQN